MIADVLEMSTVIEPNQLPGFVETRQVKEVIGKALNYMEAGFHVHFRGGAGTGKTTLALHAANLIGRPVVLIHGDDEFSTSDLVGGEHGYRFRKVVDRFVSKVFKLEEDMVKKWVDNRLTVACKYGFTLVYDEFTRSRPEANNVLLSVLQEKMLDFPRHAGDGSDDYLKVHPNFTAIFTSNPEEYAGVHKTQDALRERMVTIDLHYFDEETEINITHSKSQLPLPLVRKIVRVARELRESGKCEFNPTTRTTIMIAKTLKLANGKNGLMGEAFKETCQDLFSSQTSRTGSVEKQMEIKGLVTSLIEKYY